MVARINRFRFRIDDPKAVQGSLHASRLPAIIVDGPIDIFEIDGSAHDGREAQDREREKNVLKTKRYKGFAFVRIKYVQVFNGYAEIILRDRYPKHFEEKRPAGFRQPDQQGQLSKAAFLDSLRLTRKYTRYASAVFRGRIYFGMDQELYGRAILMRPEGDIALGDFRPLELDDVPDSQPGPPEHGDK